MKAFLYPIVKTSYLYRSFSTFVFLFSLTLFSLSTSANTVVIGTGSGSVIKTSMGTLVAGDTLAITAGTYSGGGQFGNLNNITIINYGGVVTFTASVDWGASATSMTGVRFTGTGSTATYGFVFDATGPYGVGPVGYTSNGGLIFTAAHYIQDRYDHIWFKGITSNCFDVTGNAQTYDGTTASLKIYKATYSYCRADNVLMFYEGNYKVNIGYQDSVDMSYNILNQTSGNGELVNSEMTNYNVHHNQVLYSGYNPLVTDQGAFALQGFGQIHHNYMKGGRGYLARISGFSLKATGVSTVYGYDNIKLGTHVYGMFDMRTDTTWFGTNNYVMHANFVVLNNTVGNLTANDGNGTGTGNNYNTPVALFYTLDGGAKAVAKNNLGFNTIWGNSGGNIVISFAASGFANVDTSNNKYYTASTVLNILSDTNANCAVKSGAPIIGAALSFSNVTTDYSGRPRANPPTIGAEEFSSSASFVTANAGSNQTIALPLDSVSLSGSGSTVSGSTISSYSWSEVSGPSTAIFSSSASVGTKATKLAAGTYIFSLKVKDANNDSSTATVTITVNAANQPPTVSAGSSQTITLPTNSVTLTGTATDLLGISSYLWTQTSGPNTATIGSSSSSGTSVTGLIAGSYIFQLKVLNIVNLSSTASVTITVNPAINQPPVVSAGSNQTITLPTSSATLSGSATDATGTIKSYLWSQVSGPNTSSITNASSSSTTVTAMAAGSYVFQLKATDNNSLSGTSTVTVTVNPAPNQPPVVSAGTAQTITLPVSSVTLTGTASDATGTISSYSWTQVSGPNTSAIASPAAIKTNITGLIAGNYVFQLKATDNGGLSATANVPVTVNPVANLPPVVSAGTAQTITLPVSSVTLTGTASDATGTISSYSWTQVSGPNVSAIASPAAIKTNITGLIAGNYVFQLKATDNGGLSATANVTVTVNPAPNQPPVANAGANQTITLPINSVSVDGSASKDADGIIASFKWTEISGPSQATIATATSVTTTINNLLQGIYVFKLTVTDNSGASASDSITVTVNAAPNQPPVANAGPSKTITLPVNSTTLDGTLSSDPDGTIASYKWAQVSGPSTATISSGNSATASISSLVAGTYVFQLTVTDNKGATGIAQVKVIVNPSVNQPPSANAGNDQTITLPVNSTTLDGSGSKDPGGVIVSFKWSKISGPATGTIANSNSVTTSINNLSQGTYVFSLTVTDNNGATNIDTVNVTVNPAPNQPPVANAGSSKTITLPINSTILDGTKSFDPDGSIVSYNWVELSGPSTATTSSVAAATLNVSNLVAGHYVFQLTVTDNSGASSVAEVNVTVNPAANVNPIANAGANQTITLPVDSVNVDGSASIAPSGSITNYNWAQVSGPSQATIASATSAASLITNLVQGTYIFQLTVTDNTGNTNTDSLTVMVNAAINKLPISNAGSSQTIILPVDSIILDGSKSSDPDGSIVSYSWIQLGGPSSAIFGDASSAITIAGSLIAGTYYFQLTVTDNSGATSKSNVKITVIPAANQAPIANAGANQNITLPVNTATVDGSASVDPDGTIASYKWSQVSGPSTATIASSSNAITGINNLVQGIYTFKLTVTDNKGATASDTLIVTVNVALNQLPVANAGTSKTVTLPVDSVILDGSKSYDPDGSIASFAWTQVSGPSTAAINDTTSSTPTVSSLVAGQYAFQLIVTDNSGATSTSQVKVTVLAAANLAPIANAGTDQALTMPVGTVALDGSKSYDPDGTIASYSWSKASGTGAVTISNSNTAKPTVSGLQIGSYVFKLTVADNKGATASAQVNVTVAAAVVSNKPPVANAGSNQTITLPLDSVFLNGSQSSDPDGSITYYIWSEASGSAGINISNPNTATPVITNMQVGQYIFQLVVTDNNGATDTSLVTVNVNAAAVVPTNQMPVANAGKDTTIAIPSTTAILNGSASTDPSGTIASYAWAQVSGPSTAGIASPDASVTNINTLVAGVYVFELTVTDNQGATSNDSVKVTVLDNTRTSSSTSSQNMLLYPNPASGTINLQVTSAATGQMKVFVYDMRGRIVMTKEYSKTSAFFSTPINISLLYGGTYSMQVTIGKATVMISKFVKQ